MRIPWGRWSDIEGIFLPKISFDVVGCLSFEERCCALPLLTRTSSHRTTLIKIIDPDDAVPDYRVEHARKITANEGVLRSSGVRFVLLQGPLVAGQDDLIPLVAAVMPDASSTIILDTTSFPKRYFCFLLKQLLCSAVIANLIVTYTQTGPDGYTEEHLSSDVMSSDQLPGFAGPLPPKDSMLAISVGFEVLSLRSLILDLYNDPNRDIRVVLPFPAPINSVRRQWSTLRQIVFEEPRNVHTRRLERAAAWDAEEVYSILERWSADVSGISLAPFGPKPHTLGMALFAIKSDCSLWYTQPKAYHPKYSTGQGETWAYVVKWRGIRCFDRVPNL